MYRLLAATVDAIHALSMVVWGLGLPLLVWHRYRRLSRAYMVFTIAFVAISVGSHAFLGECVLTTWARQLWLAGGGYRDGVPFTAHLASVVAGLHPERREVVLAWELAVGLSSVGTLWCWVMTRQSGHPGRAKCENAPIAQPLRSGCSPSRPGEL